MAFASRARRVTAFKMCGACMSSRSGEQDACPSEDDRQTTTATRVAPMIKNYYTVRMALIGEPNVGKTAILTQYIHSKFQDPTPTTIGIDFMLKKIDINENLFIKLHLWDTAGQEKFYSLVTSYLRTCCAFLLVFDVMQWETFVRAAWWLSKIRQCRGDGDGDGDGHGHGATNCHIMLVGNMRDRDSQVTGGSQRQVPADLARQWARENGLVGYHEVSAKTGEGISTVFEDALCHLMAAGVLTDTPDSGVPPCPTGVEFHRGDERLPPLPLSISSRKLPSLSSLSSLRNRSWGRRRSERDCC